MTESVLEPLGIEVSDVSVRDAEDSMVHRFRGLLADHGVIVVRDQTIDDDDFLTFLSRFGAPVFTVGETPVPGHPHLNIVSNVGRSTPPRSVFHVDTSYVRHPPAYTALRAVHVPPVGGETLFTNQYRAYQTLPPELRRRLTGRTVTHAVTGVDPGEHQEREAEHPIFRAHPVSGRTALYLSSPQRCVAISGMEPGQARSMIEFLYAHSTTPDNTYRHHWQSGDLVMWDNGAVMHKADHVGVVGDRVMHRGMIDGYPGRPAAAAGRGPTCP
jgi:taurine dioxygenase